MHAKDFLNEWVMWGGIPTRRADIYEWAQKTGARFHAGSDEAMDEREALAIREQLRASGVLSE